MTLARKSAAVLFLLLLIVASHSQGATLPVPDSIINKGYMPGVVGDPTRPMWSGTSWNDSTYSTGASALHAIGITGSGVSVAVFDSGFDTTHERLRDNIVASFGITMINDNPVNPADRMYSFIGTINPDDTYTGDLSQYMFLGSDIENGDRLDYYGSESLAAVHLPEGIDDPTGGNNHGTHVAGSVVGMAPDAGLVLLNGASVYRHPGGVLEDPLPGWRVANLMGEKLLMAWTADNAEQYNIVSFNGSYGTTSYPLAGSQAGMEDADRVFRDSAEGIAMLKEEGILPFFCAHNQSWNNYTTSPAANTDGIAVGALSPWGVVTSFSNLSSKVVLLAPGQTIYSAIPTWKIGAQTGINGYDLMNGTSMASPHVAGAVALLKSGARNASMDEIYVALVETGDLITYDGSLVLPVGFFSNFDPKDYGFGYTLDEWREALATAGGEDPAQMLPLEQTEYRFIRVDKAYKFLTAMRTIGLVPEAMRAGSNQYSILSAFSEELYKNLDKTTADLFQRLDGQDGATLARAARQLGPTFTNTTLESASFGVLGMHSMLGRRTSINRSMRTARTGATPPPAVGSDNAVMNLSAAPGHSLTAWAEGFGGYIRRDETTNVSGYNGHYAGLLAGVEKSLGDDLSFGGFAAWSNHRANGDSKAKGNWGTLGTYAGLGRNGFGLDASVAGGVGDYDLARGVYGPMAVFPGYVYAPMFAKADADSSSWAVSARLAGEYAFEHGIWRFGPAVEGQLSHSGMRSYTEGNAGGLNLHVDSHSYTYGEFGGGLKASALFRSNGRPVEFAVKLMGLYGRSSSRDMTGRFTLGGSRFSVPTERFSGGWFVPETSLTWGLTERADLSLSYQGRIGSKNISHTGSLSIGFSW